MPRGAAGGVATFALTAALACDNGGFDPTTWNLALVAVCAAALALIVVDGGARPGVHATVFLLALAALTAWTALSYFWSDSPPFAPVESQRVALYFAIAAAVVVARRWFEPRWVAGGVVAAATLVALWNLVVHVRGVSTTSGAAADPVGYANSLALLCVLAIVLLLCLPRPAIAVLPVLVADLALQHSTGALAALVVSLAVLALSTRLRLAAAAVLIACAVASPFALRGHERTAYWRVAIREAQANPVLGSGAGTFADWWLRERPHVGSTKEAHSLDIESLAELGPIGLALVLVVFALPVAASVRTPFGGAVLAYAVGAAVDFHWELAGVTTPAIVVAATALSRAGPRRSFSALPVFVVLAAAGVLAYAGNAHLAAAQAALQRGDRERAVAEARSALRFAPFSADAWGVIGDAEANADAYRRALRLDPNSWSLWSRLAGVTSGEPRRLAMRKAARLNPLGG